MKKIIIISIFILGIILPSISVKATSIGGINVDTVTSGDGLYTDQYENGRYVYKGGNPNNYIVLDKSKSKPSVIGYDLIVDNIDYGVWKGYDPPYFSDEQQCHSILEQELYFYPNEKGTCTLKDGEYRLILNNVLMTDNYLYSTEEECLNDLNYGLSQYYPGATGKCTSHYGYDSDDLWRVVSIEKDGTIKVMKYNSIGKMAWDSNNSTDWSNASLNTYLNNDYYNSLSDNIKNLIVNHDWAIGDSGPASKYYPNIFDLVSSEKMKNWNGKIGLMSLRDYLQAIDELKCNSNYYHECSGYNWIYQTIMNSSGFVWTISPTVKGTALAEGVYVINSTPYQLYSAYVYNRDSNWQHFVYPSFYITSNIKLSGSGTEDDPYIIVDEGNNEEENINNKNEQNPQVVEVPSTSAYASIIIAVLGIVCVIVSVFVMRRVTKKAN